MENDLDIFRRREERKKKKKKATKTVDYPKYNDERFRYNSIIPMKYEDRWNVSQKSNSYFPVNIPYNHIAN